MDKLDDLQSTFMHLFQTTRTHMRRRADQLLSKNRLTLATGTCFWVFTQRGDGITQSELAKEMDIAAPTLVRQLDILESQGLLERCEADGDRRKKLVYRTAKGRELSSRINRISTAVTHDLMAGISAKEIELVNDVLRKIIENGQVARKQGTRRPS